MTVRQPRTGMALAALFACACSSEEGGSSIDTNPIPTPGTGGQPPTMQTVRDSGVTPPPEDHFVPAFSDFGGRAASVGATNKATFPTTAGAAQAAPTPDGHTNLNSAGGYDGTIALLEMQPNGGVDTRWATYWGGSDRDTAVATAIGPDGDVYVVGDTESPDLPTLHPVQAQRGGLKDCWVGRFSADGKPVFVTYLGGSDHEEARAVRVDATGVYVVGRTSSADFPSTPTSAQPTFGGNRPGYDTMFGNGDAFVAKLALDGSTILWSTFIGGSDFDDAASMFVDSTGAVYVAGGSSSTNFPTTSGALQPNLAADAPGHDQFYVNYDAFITKISPDGTTRVASTLMGGDQIDSAIDLTVAADGTVYFSGNYASSNFYGAPAGTPGVGKMFVAELSPDLGSLVAKFVMDVSGDGQIRHLALRKNGDLAFAGVTLKTPLPVDSKAADTTVAGDADGFVGVLPKNLANVASLTLVGGSAFDAPVAFALDSQDRPHLFMRTDSTNLKVSGGGTSLGGGYDGYWTALEADGSRIDTGSYFGGPDDDDPLGAAFSFPR